MSLASRIEYDNKEKIVIISSGSGLDSGTNYLDFFVKYEANFSIVDVNHHDLEAIGVKVAAKKLHEELPQITCDVLYADHYINYSI